MTRCLPLIFLSASLARAASYYVDPDSGDDTANGTSTGTAWKHLPGTWGVAGSGWSLIPSNSIVWVKGGTTHTNGVWLENDWYTNGVGLDSVQIISGHLDSPAWGTGRAVIDCMTNDFVGVAIGASNLASGLTVTGFEIRYVKSSTAPPFDGTRGSAAILCGGNYGAQYIRVSDCYIHHAFRATAGGSDDDRGHGIETKQLTNCVFESNVIMQCGTKGIELYRSKNNRIRRNFIYGTGDHGLVISAANNDVHGNLIYMMPSEGIQSAVTYAHQPVYGIKVSGTAASGPASLNDIWNNIIYRDEPYNTTNWAQGLGFFYVANSNRAVHNTIIFCRDGANGGQYGTCVSIGSEDTETTNNLVANSILFRSLNYSSVKNSLWMHSNTTYTATIEYNTISYTNNTTDQVMSYGVQSLTAHHNMTVASYDAFSFPDGTDSANNVQMMPTFTGGTFPTTMTNGLPNSSYFVLAEGNSNAVIATGNQILGAAGRGYDSTSTKFELDVIGNLRDTNWSMGAYEYGGAAPPAPGTTNTVTTRPRGKVIGRGKLRTR